MKLNFVAKYKFNFTPYSIEAHFFFQPVSYSIGYKSNTLVITGIVRSARRRRRHPICGLERSCGIFTVQTLRYSRFKIFEFMSSQLKPSRRERREPMRFHGTFWKRTNSLTKYVVYILFLSF